MVENRAAVRAHGQLIQLYGEGPADKTCRDCVNFMRFERANKWFKCALTSGGHKSTDWRALWSTCGEFKEAADECDRLQELGISLRKAQGGDFARTPLGLSELAER